MNNQEKLNQSCPASNAAKLGDKIVQLTKLINEMKSALAYVRTACNSIMKQTACYSASGASGNGTLWSTANAITYGINGQIYTKAATDSIDWSSSHNLVGNLQECYYMLCIDAKGNFSTIQGPVVAAGSGCVLPNLPNDVAPVARVKVVTSSISTFLAGETSFDFADLASVRFTNTTATIGDIEIKVAVPAIISDDVDALDESE